MKKISIIQSILFSLLLTTTGFSQNYPTDPQASQPYDDAYYDGGDNGQEADPGAYDVFYDDLSPYGSWINYAGYGYVWIPRVTGDFQPYGTEGHWVMTNYGWTWVSDYRWGWAAFHHGRWAFEPRYGWMWIPGREWGPAWVSWRQSDAYFGWAPMGPRTRISINISCPYDHYRFVPRRHFTNRNVYNYYSDRRNNVTIINNTTIINETHVVNKNKYYYGPRKDFVERAVGQSVRVANVYDNPRPGADDYKNDRVNVYRPRIDKAPAGVRSAPKRVASTSDLQPISKERQLTSSVRREKPQNTEGAQTRPQVNQPRRNETPRENPNINREPMQNNTPRPDVRQPRRNETPRENPNVNREPMQNNMPRPDVRQSRRNETPRENPNVNRQPMQNNTPRPEVNQPRRNETPRENLSVSRQPMQNNTPRPEVRQPRIERENPQPAKSNEPVQRKKNNRENNL